MLAMGKPPKPSPCNINNICEYAEYQTKLSFENQPCPDCAPKTYPNLEIDQIGNQVITAIDGRIYQYKGTADGIRDTWASRANGASSRTAHVGDIDNDGQKEFFTVVNYSVGKKARYDPEYNQKILIYESGQSQSDVPAWTSGFLETAKTLESAMDAIVEDVDGDGLNELIVLMQKWYETNHLDIYRIVYQDGGYRFVQQDGTISENPQAIWTIANYTGSKSIYTIDAGDADNVPGNEIILAMFSTNAPIIWKWKCVDPGNGFWEETLADPIYVYKPGLSFLGIDVARARNVDNEPGNEIIAGGNNQRLMIWKYDPETGRYKNKFISDDLLGLTQGVDASDIDGCGSQNEIAVGAMGELANSSITIFKHQNGTYEIIKSISIEGAVLCLSTGDLDDDDKAEIVSSTQGISIYKIDQTGSLQRIMNSYFGNNFEVR